MIKGAYKNGDPTDIYRILSLFDTLNISLLPTAVCRVYPYTLDSNSSFDQDRFGAFRQLVDRSNQFRYRTGKHGVLIESLPPVLVSLLQNLKTESEYKRTLPWIMTRMKMEDKFIDHSVHLNIHLKNGFRNTALLSQVRLGKDDELENSIRRSKKH